MPEQRRGSRKPTDDDIAAGLQLRALRKQVGVSQQDLARQLGISSQQLSKYESGRNRVSAGMLERATAWLRGHLVPGDLSFAQAATVLPRGFSEAAAPYGAPVADRAALAEEWAMVEAMLARLKARMLG